MPNEENMAMAMARAVSASTPLERAQEQLHDARLRRADYFMRLGTTANHNGTMFKYNQNGLNRIDAEILNLSRRASSLVPPAPHGEAVKSKAPSYNNKPVKERVPRGVNMEWERPPYRNKRNANKSRAPLNSNWNTNTMNLSRVNSSLFSYNTPKAPSYNNAKAMAVPNYNGNKNGNNNANKNANKTRATRKNRKNRRSTRKN